MRVPPAGMQSLCVQKLRRHTGNEDCV